MLMEGPKAIGVCSYHVLLHGRRYAVRCQGNAYECYCSADKDWYAVSALPVEAVDSAWVAGVESQPYGPGVQLSDRDERAAQRRSSGPDA